MHEVVTVFPSAVRPAATYTSASVAVGRHEGVRLFLRVTAVSQTTTPTLNVKVQSVDPVSGTWFDLTGAAFAEVTGAATPMMSIYPGMAGATNTKIDIPPGREFRVLAVVAGTDATFTFSLGAELLP